MHRLEIFALLAVLTLGAVAALPAPAAAQMHASVNVSFFYDSLAPYGQWMSYPSYGYVWRPTHISTGWRPYMNGRWLYTDAGWAFDSYEPFGWATFHYGRWTYDPYYGWIWVPGTQWSPAWVDFQIGDGWVGWAPLPPGVSVYASFGSGGYRSRIDPRGYCFVEDRRFLDTRVDRYVAPWDRNSTYLRSSRGATRFTAYGDAVVNRGLPVDRIERSLRRAVPRVPIVDVPSYRDIATRRDRGFAAYRPRVRASADHRPASVEAPLARWRPAVAEPRSGRTRVEVSKVRQPARQNGIAGVRRTQEPRRVAVSPPPSRSPSARLWTVERSRRQEVRPEHAAPRAPQSTVRRSVTVERRNVVTQKPHGAAPVHQRQVQVQQRAVRQQTAHPAGPRPHAPRNAPAQKKQHGNGRPHG